MTVNGQKVTFTYDAGGTPLTMKVYTETEENGTTVSNCDTYYYITNLQGDVMALANSDGNLVVSYEYSAYGVMTITLDEDTTAKNLNPLTYRGYVYDAETDLYYLQSRYYDPAIGRFINADGLVSTGQGLTGNNMFAYCGNNPVNRADPSGLFFKELGLTIIGMLYHLTTVLTNSIVPSDNYGTAPEFTEISTGSNYSFTYGGSTAAMPGEISGVEPSDWNNINDVVRSVAFDYITMGYSVRVLSGPNDAIYENERRIAVRVSRRDVVGTSNGQPSHPGFNAYFIIQTQNGKWAEKPLNMCSQYFDSSEFNYTWIRYFNIYIDGQFAGGTYVKYESDIVYLAIGTL